jgi:hypothetical protein
MTTWLALHPALAQFAEPATIKLLVVHALDPHPMLLPFEIPLVLFALARRAILSALTPER